VALIAVAGPNGRTDVVAGPPYTSKLSFPCFEYAHMQTFSLTLCIGRYNEPIPPGLDVPAWAYMDVTVRTF